MKKKLGIWQKNKILEIYKMVLTNKEKYNKKYNNGKDMTNSLYSIGKKTNIKKNILQEVYNRGIGAYKGNIESVRLKSGKKDYSVKDKSKKMSKEQWAMARVYSFVMGGTTQKTTDSDLWKEHKKSLK
jgi:hypothetical protein